jgi:hypothetical protein
MRAAELPAIALRTMAHDTALAMRTDGRQPVYGAFKAVERIWDTVHDHLEGLVVDITTLIAGGHGPWAQMLIVAQSHRTVPETNMAKSMRWTMRSIHKGMASIGLAFR